MELERLRRPFEGLEPAAPPPPTAKQAAVAAVVRSGPAGAEVMLIRRAEREGDPWSGHMAFPGGHIEPGETPLAAAMRETEEEVGLSLAQHGALLGPLPPAHAQARARRVDMAIYPFVFEAPGPLPALRPNHEVAEVHWAPLAPMFAGDNHTLLRYEQGEFPGWDIGGGVVWGLTYRMLGSLFALVEPSWRPRAS
ncbi:MAG: hypothetical protein RLZZ174_222 [Pseudomonadota bacterium]